MSTTISALEPTLKEILMLRKNVPNINGNIPFPIVRNGSNMYIDKSLKSIVDLKLGKVFNLDWTEGVTKVAIGTHPDILNPDPLSLMYLLCLHHAPIEELPVEYLVDSTVAPKAYILNLETNGVFDHTKLYRNIIWLWPNGGYAHPTIVGFKYIPGFKDYVINDAGEVRAIFAGTLPVEPDGVSVRLMHNTGVMVIVKIAKLQILANGLYDETLDESIFYVDGDPTNYSYLNIARPLVEDTSLAVLLTTQEDNVENY